jgi:salicylate hydroxylase
MSAQNIQIIGAGIAGLTTALALARNGHEVAIVDQAPALSEVGAGLQMSPNASRVLMGLGLGDALDRAMTRPAEISLASGYSLRAIARVPCGNFAAERWGAPYGVMHRADLQAMLLQAVEAEPRCHLHLGQRMEVADLEALHKADGVNKPQLVIGADGVWSQTRRFVAEAAEPRFSGQVAWRFKVATERTRTIIDPHNVTAFLAPRTHLVAYPLEAGRSINMVAIARGKDPGRTWAAHENPTDRAGLLQAFGDWHPDLVTILREAPEMTWWPLFEMPDGRWYDDSSTVLIGDAAHAMTPFAAQGAAMAIEDGFELAQALTDPDSNRHAQILRFENHRRARIDRARKRAGFNKFAYHARGPFRLGRDIVLGLRSPESLAGDLDWLYGYRAPGL